MVTLDATLWISVVGFILFGIALLLSISSGILWLILPFAILTILFLAIIIYVLIITYKTSKGPRLPKYKKTRK